MPDFLIIGSIKCGTTSLYHYLSQHNQVIPATTKEVRFFYDDFNGHYKEGLDWYVKHFPQDLAPGQITGEASPRYIYDPVAANHIREHIPDAKFILLLRNPVDQLYSHYQMRLRDGDETKTFEEAIRPLLEGGVEQCRGIEWIDRSNHLPQVEHWFSVFPNRGQTKILISEEFFAKPQQVFNEVCTFLNIEQQDIDVTPQFVGQYEPIDPQVREQLHLVFTGHNQQLSQVLDRALPWS